MAEGTVTLSTKEYMKLVNENKAMKEALEGKGILLKNVGWNSDGETEDSFILVPEERKNEFLTVAFKQTLDMLNEYIKKFYDLRYPNIKKTDTLKECGQLHPTEDPHWVNSSKKHKPHTHWWKP